MITNCRLKTRVLPLAKMMSHSTRDTKTREPLSSFCCMRHARASKRQTKPSQPRYTLYSQTHLTRSDHCQKHKVQRRVTDKPPNTKNRGTASRANISPKLLSHRSTFLLRQSLESVPYSHPSSTTMSNRPLAVAKSRLPATTTRATPLDQPLSYEEREVRNRAARVLENEEMLLLLSRQRHEVIPF